MQVVVATNCPLQQAIVLDSFCHRTKSAFIRADVRGVFASVFCDFGPSHTVLDVDGEDPPNVCHLPLDRVLTSHHVAKVCHRSTGVHRYRI